MNRLGVLRARRYFARTTANFNDSETFELGCIRSMTSLSKSLVKFRQRHNCLTRHRMPLY